MSSFGFGLLLTAVFVHVNILAANNRFGCPFINDEYELFKHPAQGPIFGASVQPLIVRNVTNLYNLILGIKLANARVLENSVFNSLDDHLKFYSGFYYARKSFEVFYKPYKVKYFAASNFVTLCVKVLEQIVKDLGEIHWPTISNSVFLSASQYGIPISRKELGNLSTEYMTTTIMGKKINSVMAAIRFSLIDGMERTRLGHIFLDPGYIIKEPIVVMEDGKAVEQGRPMENIDRVRDIFYSSLPSNDKFITGRSRSGNIIILNSVHSAYCSIMDLTQKLDLLRFERAIVKRKKDGGAIAGLIYNALPVGHAQVGVDRDKILFFKDTVNGTKEKSFNWSNFKNAAVFSKMNAIDRAFVNDVIEKIGQPNFHKKLYRLYKMMEDEAFLTGSYMTLLNLYKYEEDSIEKEEETILDRITEHIAPEFSIPPFKHFL